MRILLDTHVVLSVIQIDFEILYPRIHAKFSEPDTVGVVSVASLWEMAIKTRLGKLKLALSLDELPAQLYASRLDILPIEIRHVLVDADPVPATRDPFDRLLLAQCQSDGLKLATIDRALIHHPLALRI